MRNKLFVLVSAFILLGYPILVSAQQDLSAQIDSGSLRVSGSCQGDVQVSLLLKSSNKSVYSSGIKCFEKKLEFTDDLGEWPLQEGEYYISIMDAVSKKEQSRFTVNYKKPTDSIEKKSSDPDPDKPKKDSLWQAIDDIKLYISMIDARLLFAHSDIEQSDKSEKDKLSTQGIIILMQEGTKNMLSLLDSLVVLLTEPTSRLLSPIPSEEDIGNGEELVSPLIPDSTQTATPLETPFASPVLLLPTASGSAILSL